MLISFDFDGTLSRPSVQEYAKKLLNRGYKLRITTTRYEDVNRYNFTCNHEDLFGVASELGLDIVFTNMQDKFHFLDGVFLHFDDDPHEHMTIQSYTDCKTISVMGGNWREKADRILKIYEDEQRKRVIYLIKEAKLMSEEHPSKDARFFANSVYQFLLTMDLGD